jgi:hypothetical protein
MYQQMEGQGGQAEAVALEHVVAQQRNALAEAKEALLAERTRNANLRRRSSPPDTSVASDWRTLRPPAGPSAAGRQFAWRHQPDPSNLLDDANADHKGASTSDVSEVGHANGRRFHLDLEVCVIQ